jgi:hypothetical protein
MSNHTNPYKIEQGIINLLQETIKCLNKNGKTEIDIVWLGTDDYEISWDNFTRIANTEYDNSFGTICVEPKLKIVGHDFMMIRAEHDGLEWWEFINFNQPKPNKIVETVNLIITKNDKLLS